MQVFYNLCEEVNHVIEKISNSHWGYRGKFPNGCWTAAAFRLYGVNHCLVYICQSRGATQFFVMERRLPMKTEIYYLIVVLVILVKLAEHL